MNDFTISDLSPHQMKIHVWPRLMSMWVLWSLGTVIGLHGHSVVDPHCSHDSDRVQSLLHHATGYDIVAPQRYAAHQSKESGDLRSVVELSGTVGALRVAVSTVDVFDSSKVCTAVGQVIPDFQGGSITCTSDSDVLTASKRDVLINTLLPQAISMHTTRLQVSQIVGNLTVSSTSACPHFSIPASHTSVGIANADLVLYISAAKTSGSTIAWAGYCQLDQHNRPIAGFVNINPFYISNLDSTMRVVTHEITHVLGFSYGYWTSYAAGSLTTVSTRGKTVNAFQGAAAVSAAQLYFGCNALTAVELEDEGGSGTANSHWERRNHFEDLMNGVAGRILKYSDVTLGLLTDLGIYTTASNASLAAEVPSFAKGLGCDFLDYKCLDPRNPAATSLFCNDTSGAVAYTYDAHAAGYCYTATYSSNLPSYFQYFPSNPRLGGGPDLVDYCPMVIAVSGGASTAGSGGLSSAVIIGLIVGGIVIGLMVVAALCTWLWKRCRRGARPASAASPSIMPSSSSPSGAGIGRSRWYGITMPSSTSPHMTHEPTNVRSTGSYYE